MTIQSLQSPGEYPPHYARYVALVPEGDVRLTLAAQLNTVSRTLEVIPEDRWDFRYAPGKWSVREVFGHVLDSERAYAYRLMTFARGHQVALARADQDLYVRTGGFHAHPLDEYFEEFSDLRRSNIALVRHLPDDAWDRRGRVGDFEITVRAQAFVMVGHVEHHLAIVRERYLA